MPKGAVKMSEIKLWRRVKYAGDVHRALLDLGWELDAATAFVEALPDAEVKPVRHGEWIDKMVRDWHCSECGRAVPKQVVFDGYCYEDKLNYCPNCGAWMDGGTNDA